MKPDERFHHLHQYKYLWRKCTQRETVIMAWKKLRKGKTRRKEVIKIESDFEYHVDLMIETLSNTRPGGNQKKAFKPQILQPKYVNEHGKNRIIYCPSIWEQWVHHIIIMVLGPIVQKFAYKFSCGSMPKRGGVYGKRELERIIKKKGFKYFAKLDIRHFFNNTRLDVVIHELEIFINDKWFIYLLRVVFTQFQKGLPLGFYISQWLANFVLCRVDWMIVKAKAIKYIRYMDDFVICANNKKFLHKLICSISKALGKLKLRLNGNYQVARFVYMNQRIRRNVGRPIDFMGFVFWRNRVTLRRRIMLRGTRMAARLKKLPVIALRQAQGMVSRLGWYKHTDTKWLYLTRIQPKISVNALKGIIKKNALRNTREISYEKRMAEGNSRLLPTTV